MFLDEIRERLEKMKPEELLDIIPPTAKEKYINPVFLADATEFHRKLYTIEMQYEDESRKLIATGMQVYARIMNEETDETIIKKRQDAELREFDRAIDRLKSKAKTIRNILWCVIHEDFDHLIPPSCKGIAFGEKNNFISYEKIEEPELPPFFKKIFKIDLDE